MTKPKWPKVLLTKVDQLSALVLYRTPDRWRYAIHAGGMIDGWLDVPIDAEPELAQSELVRFVEEGTARKLNVAWKPADKPEWWTTEVSFAD